MLELFLSYFLEYQYWLFFGVTFIAAFGFPVPATALILAGGAFYSQGYFEIFPLFSAGFFGVILGDMTGYLLSFFYGKDIFTRIGFGKVIHSPQFEAFVPFFQRHAFLSVFITRFLLTGLGPAVNILAGISRMLPIHFFLSDILGEILYVGIFLGVGYSFGSQWESILNIIDSLSTMLMTSVLILIIGYFGWIYRRKQYRKKTCIKKALSEDRANLIARGANEPTDQIRMQNSMCCDRNTLSNMTIKAPDPKHGWNVMKLVHRFLR